MDFKKKECELVKSIGFKDHLFWCLYYRKYSYLLRGHAPTMINNRFCDSLIIWSIAEMTTMKLSILYHYLQSAYMILSNNIKEPIIIDTGMPFAMLPSVILKSNRYLKSSPTSMNRLDNNPESTD
jgi:hypothetical protein